jgi:hypothetical protein
MCSVMSEVYVMEGKIETVCIDHVTFILTTHLENLLLDFKMSS